MVYFLKVYYYTTFQDPKLTGASIIPTSQVRPSAMLLLLTTDN
jgi:hypothetical protein